MTDLDQNNTAQAISAGMQLAEIKSKLTYIEKVPFLLVPENCTVKDLEGFLVRPRYIREWFKTSSLDSFIAYLGAYGAMTDQCAIFFTSETDPDESLAIFNAYLDYHSFEGDSIDLSPGRRTHRASFSAKPSEQWKTWRNSRNSWFEQSAFGDFLEDHEDDISVEDRDTPSLREIALNFSSETAQSLQSSQRLSDGSFQFVYSSQTSATGPSLITVPEFFFLAIPIIEGSDVCRVKCRLRYRVQEGKLKLGYKVCRVRDLEERAVEFVTKCFEERLPEFNFFSGITTEPPTTAM